MTDERKAELFDEAMMWIYGQTGESDIIDYAIACQTIGMTRDEIDNELAECGIGQKDSNAILNFIAKYR